MNEQTILRMPAVLAMTGISRSRIYVYMSRETDPFPRPIRLGPNSVGWRKAEVEAWLASRERAGSTGGMSSCLGIGSARPEVQSGTGAACLNIGESTPEPYPTPAAVATLRSTLT